MSSILFDLFDLFENRSIRVRSVFCSILFDPIPLANFGDGDSVATRGELTTRLLAGGKFRARACISPKS